MRGPRQDRHSEAEFAVRRFLNPCIEVLNGFRPAAHLRKLAQPRDAALLVSQALAAAQKLARTRRDSPQASRLRVPPPAVMVAMSFCEPRPGVIEAAAVLATPDKTWALPFRLECHGNRWLAVTLHLL
ncbi:Rv3235 family protein [Actinoplanes sp. NPDC051494]|uniref:Rv3235 family protein n=1 Tax=Actinoplanes sp. NPDC051494 TaxID=3363907 RepID=UPI0037958553